MTAEDREKDTGPGKGDSELARRMARAGEVSRREASDRALNRAGTGSVIRFGAVVVMILAIMTMVIVSVGGASKHDEAVRANLHTIDELRTALGEEKVAADTQADAEALKRTLTEASVSGGDLESIQNEMAGLDMEAKDPTGALEQYAELVDESRGYYTVGSLTGGSFLPHGRWYQPFEPGRDSRGQAAWVALPGDEWGWRFVPTKTVDRSGNVAGVWLATLKGGDQDGQLLAWVSGWFDSRKSVWYGMSRGLSDLGVKHSGATNSSMDFDGDEGTIMEPVPDTQKLIDDAQKAAQRQKRSGGGSASSTSTPSSTPADEEPGTDEDEGAGDTGAGTDDPGLDDPGLGG